MTGVTFSGVCLAIAFGFYLSKRAYTASAICLFGMAALRDAAIYFGGL